MLKYSTRFMLIALLLILLLSSGDVTAQNGTVEFGIFDSFEVAPGSIVQVPVSVRNVQELYGVDFTLTYDPAIIQIEDADPAQPGVQAALGKFLDPGLLLFNTADNDIGSYRFAMSQYNPSEPKSGDGDIVVLNLRGITEGESLLLITDAKLASGEGTEIIIEQSNASIIVKADVPTQAVTYPVSDLTGLVVLGTKTPTPLPTETPAPTLTSAPVNLPDTTKSISATNATNSDSSNVGGGNKSGEADNEGHWLKYNWWIILILVVAIIAAASYYWLLKKNDRKNGGNGS